jgi:hypothetical protein
VLPDEPDELEDVFPDELDELSPEELAEVDELVEVLLEVPVPVSSLHALSAKSAHEVAKIAPKPR